MLAMLQRFIAGGVSSAAVSQCVRSYGKYFFKIAEPVDGYTTKPLKTHKLAGRGPDGRIVNKYLGGGLKMDFHMVDHCRLLSHMKDFSQPTTLQEQVMQLKKCYFRSATIALVASGEHKRWITATLNMKVGDIIKTTTEIPRNPIQPNEGDAVPLGSLPIGTLVSNVEKYPGMGAAVCRAAGCEATLVRRTGDRCIIRMPSRREINVDHRCIAVVGQVSNPGWQDIHLGKAGRLRQLGFRPRSGWWQRKGGRFGRRIKYPKPAVQYTAPPTPKVPTFRAHFRLETA